MADSRIKLMISFLLIIAVTSMRHWYFPVFIFLLCTAAAVKLDLMRDYSKRLIFPLVLASFILAVQGLDFGVTGGGTISVAQEGIGYGFLIFSRILASVSVLLLLVLTTPENEVLESMRWFRVPKTIIEISSFMSRYIKTFSAEGKKLKSAQESRCGFSKKLGYGTRLHNIASMCGALIAHAFARSEEVYRAMLSRAWTPDMRYSPAITPLNKSDIILCITFISGLIGLIGLDRFL